MKFVCGNDHLHCLEKSKQSCSADSIATLSTPTNLQELPSPGTMVVLIKIICTCVSISYTGNTLQTLTE